MFVYFSIEYTPSLMLNIATVKQFCLVYLSYMSFMGAYVIFGYLGRTLETVVHLLP